MHIWYESCQSVKIYTGLYCKCTSTHNFFENFCFMLHDQHIWIVFTLSEEKLQCSYDFLFEIGRVQQVSRSTGTKNFLESRVMKKRSRFHSVCQTIQSPIFISALLVFGRIADIKPSQNILLHSKRTPQCLARIEKFSLLKMH